MRIRLAALAALISAMILVGSSVAVGRLVATTLPIAFASMVRFALASLCLYTLIVWREKSLAPLQRRTMIILGAQALSGSFLFTLCMLEGLRFTGAAQAGVVAAATPAAVALMGSLLFREPLAFRAMTGIMATTAGIALLGYEHGSCEGSNPLTGNLLVLCAVAFEAVFLLLRRTVREPLSPLLAAFWVSLFGFGLFLIPGCWELGKITPAMLTTAALLELVYYGLGVTAAAYILWFYGVVRVDAATAGTVTGVMPMAALASAALLCGEQLGVRELAGCAAVVCGIGFLARAKTQSACLQGKNLKTRR